MLSSIQRVHSEPNTLDSSSLTGGTNSHSFIWECEAGGTQCWFRSSLRYLIDLMAGDSVEMYFIFSLHAVSYCAVVAMLLCLVSRIQVRFHKQPNLSAVWWTFQPKRECVINWGTPGGLFKKLLWCSCVYFCFYTNISENRPAISSDLITHCLFYTKRVKWCMKMDVFRNFQCKKILEGQFSFSLSFFFFKWSYLDFNSLFLSSYQSWLI